MRDGNKTPLCAPRAFPRLSMSLCGTAATKFMPTSRASLVLRWTWIKCRAFVSAWVVAVSPSCISILTSVHPKHAAPPAPLPHL